MLKGIVPTRPFELKSIVTSEEQSPMLKGITPVMLASEMTSFFRYLYEERFVGKGSSR